MAWWIEVEERLTEMIISIDGCDVSGRYNNSGQCNEWAMRYELAMRYEWAMRLYVLGKA